MHLWELWLAWILDIQLFLLKYDSDCVCWLLDVSVLDLLSCGLSKVQVWLLITSQPKVYWNCMKLLAISLANGVKWARTHEFHGYVHIKPGWTGLLQAMYVHGEGKLLFLAPCPHQLQMKPWLQVHHILVGLASDFLWTIGRN